MFRYLAVRAVHGVIVIFLVTTLVFAILHIAPGDPVTVLVGEAKMTNAQLAQIRHFWGLDQPAYLQYFHWLGNMARGDFGTSIVADGRSVGSLLRDAAPNTIQLNVLALLLAIGIALPMGCIAAVKSHSLFDGILMILSTLGVSVPNFWLGLMLIILFSAKLGWLPAFGLSDWRSYILPVFVLAAEQMALLARLVRATTLEVLGQEYVTTARSKGLANRVVLARHVVRNSLLPVVTVIGLRVGFLLSGTIVIETVFAWPGVGRLLFQSITDRDYQVVQAIVLLGAVVVVLANLATDLVYAFIDPRIRYR
jgi:peptide/nickel transport system permease protein